MKSIVNLIILTLILTVFKKSADFALVYDYIIAFFHKRYNPLHAANALKNSLIGQFVKFFLLIG